MQRPVIFNKHLNRKWKEKENEYMANRLDFIKSEVDLKCPQSYITFKTKLKREKPINNISKYNTLFKINLNTYLNNTYTNTYNSKRV